MNIAIFGDSFSTSELVRPTWAYLGKSWVDIVEEKHDIVNFGKPGSCFNYSYKLFLANHKKFDAVIFFVTDPARKYVEEINNLLLNQPNTQQLNKPRSFDIVKDLIIKFDYKVDRYIRILDSFKVYHEDWMDAQLELHIHDLMVKNLVDLKKNIVVVPCFHYSTSVFSPKDTVYTISKCELDSLDLTEDMKDTIRIFENYWDARLCHLSEPNNIILGNKILSALEQGINYLDLDKDDFILKLDKPAEYYFKKRS